MGSSHRGTGHRDDETYLVVLVSLTLEVIPHPACGIVADDLDTLKVVAILLGQHGHRLTKESQTPKHRFGQQQSRRRRDKHNGNPRSEFFLRARQWTTELSKLTGNG